MVADALNGSRTIGMAMPRPDEDPGDVRPAVRPVGGAGEIVEADELEDGRYNILLEGRFRYRILEEVASPSPYRTARIQEMASIPFANAEEEARVSRSALEMFEKIRAELDLPPVPEGRFSTERLASEIALRLRYTPAELQAFLETDSLAARFRTLIGRMGEWESRIRLLAPFRPADLDATKN